MQGGAGAPARWRSSARSTATASRVVRIGDFSTELCGGTHLGRRPARSASSRCATEGAVAAGVRRIEAVTGAAARRDGGAGRSACCARSATFSRSLPARRRSACASCWTSRRALEQQLAGARGQRAALEGRRSARPAPGEVSGVAVLGRPDRRARRRRAARGRRHGCATGSAPASSCVGSVAGRQGEPGRRRSPRT